ncbi:sorting nexin 7 [Stylonychia lemnae]|uniref:Sorting nexin 7 n=1 Tax=Stylonychia lemnae TaxID=5949 RepID=A0A077ZQE1_STYLE|nr:sorting nexin 7 [Stylonychia lemnae]|eukprot:CDW72128.1 sorting nexin 7 [Stylonychia lemnae]
MPGHREYEIKTIFNLNPCETNMSQILETHIVKKRYSDFEQLYELLVNNYLECLLPPLPEKSIQNFTSDEDSDFVRIRQRELEYFLNRLNNHKKLSYVQEFRDFLREITTPSGNQQKQSPNSLLNMKKFLQPQLVKDSLYSFQKNSYVKYGYSLLQWGQQGPDYNQLQKAVNDDLEREYQSELVSHVQLLLTRLDNLVHNLTKQSLVFMKQSVALKNVADMYEKFEIQREKCYDLDMDQSHSSTYQESLTKLAKNSSDTHQFYQDRVLADLKFFHRFIKAIDRQIWKREELIDAFNRIQEKRQSNLWSKQNEQNLVEMKRKIQKVTKRQLEEYTVIHQEIIRSISVSVKMLGSNHAIYYTSEVEMDASLCSSDEEDYSSVRSKLDSFNKPIQDDSRVDEDIIYQPQNTPQGMIVSLIYISDTKWKTDKQIAGGHREYEINCNIKGSIIQSSVSQDNNDQTDEKRHSVQRRFKDFRQFQRLLRTNYLDFIVPPLPKKSIRDKVSQDESLFVTKRRQTLLLFLNRVADHPILGQTEEFVEFLTDQKYYHQIQDESGLTSRLKSFWNNTPKLQSILINQNYCQTKQVPDSVSQNIIADIKLEQEYQISVVSNSLYLKQNLDQIEKVLKNQVIILDKKVRSLSKLNGLIKSIQELGIQDYQVYKETQTKNDIFYTDNDEVQDSIKHFHYENIQQLSLYKNELLIESISFYKRYLESLHKSVDLRQDFINKFSEKQHEMTKEKKKQQHQRIKDVTRGHIDEYQRLCSEIETKIILNLGIVGNHYSSLYF